MFSWSTGFKSSYSSNSDMSEVGSRVSNDNARCLLVSPPSGVRLSEAEPQSAACGRVAAEGWTLPVDPEHLPLVDHTSGLRTPPRIRPYHSNGPKAPPLSGPTGHWPILLTGRMCSEEIWIRSERCGQVTESSWIWISRSWRVCICLDIKPQMSKYKRHIWPFRNQYKYNNGNGMIGMIFYFPTGASFNMSTSYDEFLFISIWK